MLEGDLSVLHSLVWTILCCVGRGEIATLTENGVTFSVSCEVEIQFGVRKRILCLVTQR